MNQLLNHMLLAFNRGQMNVGYSQLGIISSVNPSDYTVKVILQPEEIETGFIPFLTPFYGWVAPPVGGEQCLVIFERGNNNVPVAALLLYWDNARAPGISNPGDTAVGEILLKHSSGSYVKLTSDGKVLINGHTDINTTSQTLTINTTADAKIISSANIDITATSGQITVESPVINLNGDVVISGDLSANDGSVTMIDGVFTTNADIITTQDVKASGISLNSHVHGGVTSGSSDTDPPT